MPKATSILSPFHNLPVGEVVDQLGSVKAQISDLETREKALRDELIRRGITAASGDAYGANVSSAVRWSAGVGRSDGEASSGWA